jgi:thiol-disulfide isomerase/thioredoxin
MDQATWVLLAALVLSSAFGAWRAGRDGRFRGTRAVKAAEPEADDRQEEPIVEGAPQADPVTALGHDLGERATLLQFSSAFCAPCRTTRRVLAEVAHLVPGVAHVEVDAEQQLDLVRRLGILRTPTTLVLDGHGHEVSRASGAPTKAAVLATLGRTLGE